MPRYLQLYPSLFFIHININSVDVLNIMNGLSLNNCDLSWHHATCRCCCFAEPPHHAWGTNQGHRLRVCQGCRGQVRIAWCCGCVLWRSLVLWHSIHVAVMLLYPYNYTIKYGVADIMVSLSFYRTMNQCAGEQNGNIVIFRCIMPGRSWSPGSTRLRGRR